MSFAKSGRHNFVHLHETIRNFVPYVTDEMLQLVEQKGVFCYDYIDKFERLAAETELPPRAQFFSRLGGKECFEEDYARAQRVWRDFNIENMGAYMLLYLLCDVSLLADVFQRFRRNSLDEYQLDPVYYVSEPHLAWSALLKYIDRPIHLITDPEMYRMIQSNICGGICHVSVRYARANNKLMGSCTIRPSRRPTYFM